MMHHMGERLICFDSCSSVILYVLVTAFYSEVKPWKHIH